MPAHHTQTARRTARTTAVAAVCLLVSALVAAPSSALAPTSPDQALWQVDGRVRAIVQTDSMILLGGDFDALIGPSGQRVARTNIAALSAVTGAPLAFSGTVNRPVWGLAVSPDGQTVYAVGDFTSASGQSRPKAAAFSTSNGALLPWNPRLDARGRAVAASSSAVYLGGDFLTVAGAARSRLVAVNTSSGAALPTWPATANDEVDTIEIAPDGSRVLVGGRFTSISGSPGQEQRKIASLHPTTGALQPWAFHPTFEVFDIVATDRFAFAAAGGSGGHAVGWDLATGAQMWSGFADGDAVAVAEQNGVVYIGGHFTSFNGQPAGHSLAVEPTTGQRIPWTVTMNSALGVFALDSHKGHLAMGGDFTRINFLNRQHLARFTEDVDTQPPSTPGTPSAVATSATTAQVTWNASVDDRATTLVYDVYRDSSSTPVGRVTSNSTGTVSFLDQGITPGSTVRWSVRASDGTNFSANSGLSNPVTMPESAVPLLTSLLMDDTDTDGRVDQVRATFSNPVTCTAPCTAPWSLTSTPSGGSLAQVTVSGQDVVLRITEGTGAHSTAVGGFRVALSDVPGGVTGANGQRASFAATAPLDRAGPVPIDITSTNGTVADVMEAGDTFTVTFSEPIDPATVIASSVKELDPSGPENDALIIVGLTDGQMDLGNDAAVPSGGSAAFTASTLTLLDNGRRVRSTVGGPCSGASCGMLSPTSNSLVTFTPEPFLKDAAGNQATGARTETEAAF